MKLKLNLNAAVTISLITILVVAVLSLAVVYRSFDQQAVSSLKIEARRKAQIVSHLIEEPMRMGDYNAVRQVTARLFEDDSIASVKVVDKYGDVILDTMKDSKEQPYMVKQVIRQSLGDITIGFHFSYFEKLATDFKIKVFTIVILLVVFIGCISIGLLSIFRHFFAELKAAFANVALGKPHSLNRNRTFSDVASIAETFNETSRKLSEVKDLEIEKAKINAMADIAAQVAHDIRSPLAAISTVEKDLRAVPEERRIMLRSAVNRLRDIANDLLDRNQPVQKIVASTYDSVSPQLLSSLIEQLLTEKRLQFRAKIGIDIHLHLDRQSYGLFAQVHPRELKRVISNLLNNSVEALTDRGKVDIFLRREGCDIEISIRDNGRGIPDDLVPKLGVKGETYGKNGGSGLGLSHARTWMDAWNGTLTIESTVGLGTTVRLRLPSIPTPSWFCERILFMPEMPIVALDDDPSIHQIWRGRFGSAVTKHDKPRLYNFSNPPEITKWVQDNPDEAQRALFLLDYELLGYHNNGLDIAEDLEIAEQSILVTSRFEEEAIRNRCHRLGMKMIPKGLAGLVPLILEKKSVFAVLIDDDELVHMTWKAVASQQQKNILTFQRPEDFFLEAEELDRETPIYVDLNLGHGRSGETVCCELHNQGFQNIYVTTGYDVKLEHLPWLKGVIGKDPIL